MNDLTFTGMLTILFCLAGTLYALPNWAHSKSWGLKPAISMCVVTSLIGVLWLVKVI